MISLQQTRYPRKADPTCSGNILFTRQTGNHLPLTPLETNEHLIYLIFHVPFALPSRLYSLHPFHPLHRPSEYFFVCSCTIVPSHTLHTCTDNAGLFSVLTDNALRCLTCGADWYSGGPASFRCHGRSTSGLLRAARRVFVITARICPTGFS